MSAQQYQGKLWTHNQVISYVLERSEAIVRFEVDAFEGSQGDISRKMSVVQQGSDADRLHCAARGYMVEPSRIVEIKLVRWEELKISRNLAQLWFRRRLSCVQAIIVSKWSPGKHKEKFSLEGKLATWEENNKRSEQADTSDWNDCRGGEGSTRSKCVLTFIVSTKQYRNLYKRVCKVRTSLKGFRLQRTQARNLHCDTQVCNQVEDGYIFAEVSASQHRRHHLHAHIRDVSSTWLHTWVSAV